jgi:hypothetical protein
MVDLKESIYYFEILMYNSWSSSNSLRRYTTPGVEKALLNNHRNDNCVLIYSATLRSYYEDVWAGGGTAPPFLTSVLDGNDQLHAPAPYPWGNCSGCPLDRRLSGPKSRFGRRAPASRYRGCGLDTTCPELGSVATSPELCNDISGSVKVVEFLTRLSYYQLLKKNSAPMS